MSVLLNTYMMGFVGTIVESCGISSPVCEEKLAERLWDVVSR